MSAADKCRQVLHATRQYAISFGGINKHTVSSCLITAQLSNNNNGASMWAGMRCAVQRGVRDSTRRQYDALHNARTFVLINKSKCTHRLTSILRKPSLPLKANPRSNYNKNPPNSIVAALAALTVHINEETQ